MTAAVYESSPAWEVSHEGDFSLGITSGRVDVPRGRPAPSPSTGLYPAHPYQPPPGALQGCAPGWELLVDQVTLPLLRRWHPQGQDCCSQPLEGII